jgi:rhodanese-related sulfurtransferase/SHS2 domain-containing protein
VVPARPAWVQALAWSDVVADVAMFQATPQVAPAPPETKIASMAARVAGRPELIDVEMAHELFEEERAHFVDARPLLDYRRSRERIPGALHIEPGGGPAETEALLALPRHKLIVAYCDEPALAASTALARQVRELAIEDGCALAGGFRAWKEAGHPVELVPPLASPARKDGPSSHVVEQTRSGVKLDVRAPSLVALFAEASLALADAFGDAIPAALAPTDHLFTVYARDAEGLLTAWLSDLLASTVEHRRLFVDVHIDTLSPRELRARARGAEVGRWRRQPPTDALPLVQIERRPSGFAAAITLAV